MATELGTAYVSVVAETSKLEAQLKQALQDGGKGADVVGRDIGKRISASASKAMRDGWRPDQDIMAGIPDTKAAQIGARIGQIIGKGVVAGMHAREAGVQFGHSFAEGAGSVGLGRIVAGWKSELSGNGIIGSAGMLAGKAFSAAFTLAAGGAVAGIGLALTKGFQRLESLDSATQKLNQMNEAAKRVGKPLMDVKGVVKAVTDSVTGTPYSLDSAFGTAVMAIGAGTKDIKRFMTDVTDAAGFAGTDLDRMGTIFTQVLAKGKLQGDEMMQLMEAGLPAKSWIEESYHLTSDQFDKMQAKGEITMDMLQKSIEDHAGGMAKAAGDTLKGAIDNMETSIARVGADFLAAIFGGPDGDPAAGMKDSIKRITEMLNNLDAWVKAHREDIRQFFDSAKDAAQKVVEVVGKVLEILNDIPGGVQGVVVAFAAWEGIKGIATVAEGILALNTALGTTATLAGAVLGPIAAIAAAGAGLAALVKDTPFDINTGPLLGPYANMPTTQGGQPYQLGGAPSSSTNSSGANPNGMAGEYLTLPGGIPGGGGPGAQAARRGAGVDVSQSFGQPGGGGRGLITGSAAGGPNSWRPSIRQALATYGPQLGITNYGAWEEALVRQIATESGGNPGADNPHDSNGRGGSQHVSGLLQFLPSTFASHNISGGGYMDPNAQIAAALSYVTNRYGMDRSGAPLWIGQGHGYANGGSVDTVPAMLAPGEHVLTSSDVQAMGGQSAVYSFRNALHRAGGGAITGQVPWVPGKVGKIGSEAGNVPDVGNGSGYPGVIGLPEWGTPGTKFGAPPSDWWNKPINPDDILFPDFMPPGQRDEWLKRWGKNAKKIQKYADGGAVGAKKLQDMRTKGAIPAGAGSTAEAGTSGVAQAIAMGGDIINGLIDQAASAAATAISAAATAGSFGAGGQAAGPAASFAIGLGANAAKRGVKYGFQMGGIGVDALLQQLTPFGMPRWLTQDYTGFVPQQQISGALTDLLSGGAQKAAGAPQDVSGIGSSASKVPGFDPNNKQHGLGATPGIGNLMGTLSPPTDPLGTQHGQANGLPPGPPSMSDANSFLSTELQQPEAQTPGQQPIFKVDNIYTTDAHGVGEELSKRGRLMQMQYAGRPMG